MNKLAEEYTIHRIKPEYQNKANILLATTGVLNSTSGMFTLGITHCSVEPSINSLSNTQHFHYTASIINKDNTVVETFTSQGSPNQCFEYITFRFSEFLINNQEEIYLQQHEELTLEEILSGNSTDTKSSLSAVQKEVDDWINTLGVRYFSELTNLSNLIEEVGEVARLIGREYGEQSFKTGERPICVKSAIADELSDVLFIVICLANQLDISLEDAFSKNMDKKTNRDTNRHKNNHKLR